ncbi:MULTISPECIES: GNAT family N-acetyltransferase [unclassified Herbaspirillum]|uniref:GNAT family N-acetyltransferase n=1 Tax=unclassified Herbaspirillum TaxID=2624150 RepID=UPI0011517E60|nr:MULTISPECIES: GNAT family N-acetyltransferase [unclassified Herbaspirillum]MBB5393351.1 ribosomal protein S18 acetylase RimI-like enzyme [Herbaspirillum sp. SJZ102]TQK03900.1 acetyltransferase (GNAT) family protein [Herbaspirillum sp. SJZ130]TQK08632.1 acetyltransferase (GNAT) family protein [Herbaspirillum sp. SJZ106]TWC71903.1 acetyltransferase (GNAT) family protein [Herbaspirillum sp. SJZ099]
MTIAYKTDVALTVEQFIDVLSRTSLGPRRPLDDLACMQGMVENANLLATAWDGELLVGVARCVTDFTYACYMSELAVDENYQRRGIGKELIRHARSRLGPRCRLRLLAAPDAADYYGHIGFAHSPRCWELTPGNELK